MIKDLISTRNKGVEQQKVVKDRPLLPPVEVSPRSSLRSFFVDPGDCDSVFKMYSNDTLKCLKNISGLLKAL